MISTMNIKVRFNRPIDDEKDYIVAGGFNFSVYGKDVEFDFEEQEYYIDSKEPCCAVFILRKPLLSEYPEFRRLSLRNIDRISEIKECFVYTGESGESDIEVMSIESISFVETEPKHLYISVSQELIEKFNTKHSKIVDALYISSWSDGDIVTRCKVNRETKEVFDIEESSVNPAGCCEGEFIELDGLEFDVHRDTDVDNTPNEYWCDAEKAEFVGIDGWSRPVYKLENGMLIKDITLGASVYPELYYSVNNEFEGEPGCEVKKAVKLLPKRVIRKIN